VEGVLLFVEIVVEALGGGEAPFAFVGGIDTYHPLQRHTDSATQHRTGEKGWLVLRRCRNVDFDPS